MSYQEGVQIGNSLLDLARTSMSFQDFQQKQKARETLLKQEKDFESAAGMSKGTLEGQRSKLMLDKEKAISEEDAATESILKGLTENGFIDSTGALTTKGQQEILTNSVNRETAIQGQTALGTNALTHARAMSRVLDRLAKNTTNKQVMTNFALSKGKQDYGKLETLRRAAGEALNSGDNEKALTYAKELVDKSMMRLNAEIVDGKLHVYETVQGARQEPQVLTVEEVLEEAERYSDKNYSLLSAQHYLAGVEMNMNPREIKVKLPDGTYIYREKHNIGNSGIEYIAYKEDGSVAVDAPDLPDALKTGEVITKEKVAEKRTEATDKRAEAANKRAEMETYTTLLKDNTPESVEEYKKSVKAGKPNLKLLKRRPDTEKAVKSERDAIKRISDIENTKSRIRATGGMDAGELALLTIVNPEAAQLMKGGETDEAIRVLDVEKELMIQSLPEAMRVKYKKEKPKSDGDDTGIDKYKIGEIQKAANGKTYKYIGKDQWQLVK